MEHQTSHRGVAMHQISIPITIYTDKPLTPHPWIFEMYTIGSGVRHRDYVDCDAEDPPSDGILTINHPLAELDCAEVPSDHLRSLLESLQEISEVCEDDDRTTNRERTARSASIRTIRCTLALRAFGRDLGHESPRGRTPSAAPHGFRLVKDNRFGFDLATSIITDPPLRSHAQNFQPDLLSLETISTFSAPSISAFRGPLSLHVPAAPESSCSSSRDSLDSADLARSMSTLPGSQPATPAENRTQSIEREDQDENLYHNSVLS